MNRHEFIRDLDEEVSTILSSDFTIDVVGTTTVPSSKDAAITFPNVDDKRQSTKLLTSCVLYIDIRRSMELNLGHRTATVAKLYSAFVRAMTRCARRHGGHVRGIIGDRVMVIFDSKQAFASAVNCAIEMHSASTYVINRHFKAREVTCGIGIDAGNMLVTKTGVRRHGSEQAQYRNLVWLGRPANLASKLTDLANKPRETVEVTCVDVAFEPERSLANLYGQPAPWRWQRMKTWDFVRNLVAGPGGQLTFNHPRYRFSSVATETVTLKAATPAILMTKAVWDGFKKACPEDDAVKNKWFTQVSGIQVPGYSDAIYGGNVFYTAYKNAGR